MIHETLRTLFAFLQDIQITQIDLMSDISSQFDTISQQRSTVIETLCSLYLLVFIVYRLNLLCGVMADSFYFFVRIAGIKVYNSQTFLKRTIFKF